MSHKKMPKQPKALKLPKKPKASASLTVWENYRKRRHDALVKGKHRQDEWKKKCDKIKSDEKKRLQLIKEFSR
jgi:hypothetical protein